MKITTRPPRQDSRLRYPGPPALVSPERIRPPGEVRAFFDTCLGKSWSAENNWHLPFLLEDAWRAIAIRGPVFPPKGPSGYAAFLSQAAEDVISSVLGAEADLRKTVLAVLLVGPVAHGDAETFHTRVEGSILPPETGALWEVVYTWLFTNLGKNAGLHTTRLLDEDLTSPIAMMVIVKDPGNLEQHNFGAAISREFVASYNYAPPVQIHPLPEDDVQPVHVLNGFWAYGQEFLFNRLANCYRQMDPGRFYASYHEAVSRLAEGLSHTHGKTRRGQQNGRAFTCGVLDYYKAIRQDPRATLILDLGGSLEATDSPWYVHNKPFFDHLSRGQVERVRVADVTKKLEDSKGFKKPNQFTILEVRGLEFDGDFIPAYDMVLKLRGRTNYRGDTNNLLDLLKEYASYAYIHKRTPGSPYLLHTGPLLFTCERLDVPFSREETRNWAGFFLQALTPPEGSRLLTCRVRRLAEIWDLKDSLRRVQRAARKNSISIDLPSLKTRLRELVVWMWLEGVPVDYCDLVLQLGDEGRVERIQMIDLERLSFGTLVGEDHVLIDTMIDLKSRLRKENWYAVLDGVYRSRETGGFESFDQIRQYLKPGSRKRRLALKTLRRLGRFSDFLAPVGGKAVWRALLQALVQFGNLL